MTGLRELVSAFYREHWDCWPSSGSHAGLAEYDDRLELPSRELYGDYLEHVRRTRHRLAELTVPESRTAAWLDHQTFDAYLALAELDLERIQHWRANTVDPVESAIAAVFTLLMRRDVSRPETIEAIRRRLAAVPEYLRAAQARIDDPIRLWVDAASPATAGAIEFVRCVTAELASRHPQKAAGLETAAVQAVGALERYGDWLRELAARPLREDPAVGGEVLREIVHTSHGLPYSLDEIAEIGRAEVDRLKRALDDTASAADNGRPWHQVLADERDRFAAEPHDLLREYREATFLLRDQLVARGVLDLPADETCDVISTPLFLRPMIPSAAYSSPGPLDPNQKGIFYVSDPPATLPPDEYRANMGQHFGYASTCAHEAYPGHHVQLCWANRAPSLARQMAHHIVFMEGWTLYCEQLMVELGILDGLLWRLDLLHSQLWRAYRILIDVGVQTGRMSIREAIETLKRELGFTELRAQAELNWYTQSPGTPMSYLLGKFETVRLREKYATAHPGSTLREFHRWLLSFGSVPQRWLHEFV